MLLSLLIPITLAAATVIPRDLLASVSSAVGSVLDSVSLPGMNVQLNSATSIPTVLDSSAKLLLGGQLAHIAALTRCPPAEVRARACGVNCDATPGYTVLTQGGEGIQVPHWGVGVSEDLAAIVVSFAGTNGTNLINTLNNAEAVLVPLAPSLAPLRTTGVPLVHLGYQSTGLAALVGIVPGVKAALASNPNISRILVTGHSQGAALSTIAALGIFLAVPADIHVQHLCYASPRIGNQDFALLVAKSLPDTQTVIFRNDAVPHVMLPGPIYRQIIGERWIQSLAGDGTNTLENSVTLSCEGEENVHCSNSVSNFDYSMSDHNGPYFGVQFGTGTCRSDNVTSSHIGF